MTDIIPATNNTPGVQAIMDAATAITRPGALLRVAMDVIGEGARKGLRTKLNQEEAIAATRSITAMLSRFGLRPTHVLLKLGRASEPSATSRFYLSRKEMEAGYVPSAKRRFAKGLDAYLDNVRAIARHAREAGHEVDEETLIDELAEAVASFLEQFQDLPGLDPDAELARDVGLIPNWISNPRRGFELARFLSEANRLELGFDARTGEMEALGEAASLHDGNTPSVPLLTRAVARHDVEVFVADTEVPDLEETGGLFDFLRVPRLKSIGTSSCLVCQNVGLGIVPDSERHGGLRMVFTLDTVTHVGMPAEDGDGSSVNRQGFGQTRVYPGIPEPGRQTRLDAGTHWFVPASPEVFLCPDYKAFVDGAFSEEWGWDAESLWTRRWLPVTAENCALVFDEAARRHIWIWSTFGKLVEETVMPDSAMTETGVESRTVRDRFSALLYAAEEPSAAGLLFAEAERRIEAFERFQAKTATADRRRKLAFRARMRK